MSHWLKVKFLEVNLTFIFGVVSVTIFKISQLYCATLYSRRQCLQLFYLSFLLRKKISPCYSITSVICLEWSVYSICMQVLCLKEHEKAWKERQIIVFIKLVNNYSFMFEGMGHWSINLRIVFARLWPLVRFYLEQFFWQHSTKTTFCLSSKDLFEFFSIPYLEFQQANFYNLYLAYVSPYYFPFSLEIFSSFLPSLFSFLLFFRCSLLFSLSFSLSLSLSPLLPPPPHYWCGPLTTTCSSCSLMN